MSLIATLIQGLIKGLIYTAVDSASAKKREAQNSSAPPIRYASPTRAVPQWTCSCGTINNGDAKICSNCGKEKEEPKKVKIESAAQFSGAVPDVDKELLARISECKTAKEIETLMIQAVEKCEKADHAKYILSLLAQCAEQDTPVDGMEITPMTLRATSLAKGFIKGGMQVYSLDRSAATSCCPVCGTSQNSRRQICLKCGVLFYVE